jgi:hypothetical protein
MSARPMMCSRVCMCAANIVRVFAVVALFLALPARAQLHVVTAQRDLSFGQVITGTTTSVAVTSPNAAMWKMVGLISIGGGFSFTLPTVLTRSGGGATMPITFCSTCARYNVGSTNPATGTTFDPANGKALTIVVLSDIYIWLGASVAPPLNQASGTYTGTVVFSVAGLL